MEIFNKIFSKKKSSIKTKFITTFLLIGVFISLVYTVTFYAFRQSIDEYEQIIKNADIANRIPIMYNVLIDDFKNYLVDSTKEYDKFQSSIDEIENLVLYIKSNTKQEHNESIAQLTGIANLFKTIKRKTSLAVKYRNQGDLDNANKEFYELSKMAEFLKDNIGQYISKELSYSIASREQIYKKNIILGIISTVLIIFITVVGLLYGIRLSQSTAKAILEIANQDVFDSNHVIEYYGEEELDKLYQQFAKLQRNIKEYIFQLTASEKRISSILNGMYDCVLTTNEQGVILSGNYAIKNVFGYEVFEILEKNIDILIPNASKSLIFNTEKAANNVYDGKFEFVGLKRTSENFPIEIGLSQITQDEEKVFIFVIHDITEHKEVEKMKNEFVSMVSHELRTPLTAIKGSLDLMMSEKITQLPDKAYKLADISRNNSTRLINLINDILDIEKISAGKMDFHYEVFELSSLVKESIATNHPIAKQYNISFELGENLTEFNINADKNRIIQVITNLLSNAAKFSFPNGRVDIAMNKQGNFVRTSVKNYGTPIPEEFKEKIFQKFTQADSSATRKKGGTGLGLSICKSIIENMNGSIGFDSNEETTVFYFDLPLV